MEYRIFSHKVNIFQVSPPMKWQMWQCANVAINYLLNYWVSLSSNLRVIIEILTLVIHVNFKQTRLGKSSWEILLSKGRLHKLLLYLPFGMMNPWKGILSVARCSKPAGATQLILWTSQRNASQKGKFCLSAKLTLRDLPKMEWKMRLRSFK